MFCKGDFTSYTRVWLVPINGDSSFWPHKHCSNHNVDHGSALPFVRASLHRQLLELFLVSFVLYMCVSGMFVVGGFHNSLKKVPMRVILVNFELAIAKLKVSLSTPLPGQKRKRWHNKLIRKFTIHTAYKCKYEVVSISFETSSVARQQMAAQESTHSVPRDIILYTSRPVQLVLFWPHALPSLRFHHGQHVKLCVKVGKFPAETFDIIRKMYGDAARRN